MIQRYWSNLALSTTLMLLASCSPADEAWIETELAGVGKTAAVEAEHFAQTQAVQLKETAEASIATEAAQAIATVSNLNSGEASGTKTGTTYVVDSGDTLSGIAERFSTSVESLIQLNRDTYPSLETNPGYLEVGWTLLVSSEIDDNTDIVSAPWSNTPGCDVSSAGFLKSPITCEEIAIDIVTDIGINIGCIELNSNPFGYYMEHTVYSGWIFIGADGVWNYGWFRDEETNEIVVGPAEILSETSYPECGIPRNP